MHRVRITGLTPPAPAIVLHRWPCALWLACPAPDSYDHAVPRGLSPRRPSRRAAPPPVRACRRRSTPAGPALMGRGWTRRGRADRPLAWTTRPPGGPTLAPEALQGPLGMGLEAIPLSPYHAGLAGPRCKRLLPLPACAACPCPLTLAGAGKPLTHGSPLHPSHL